MFASRKASQPWVQNHHHASCCLLLFVLLLLLDPTIRPLKRTEGYPAFQLQCSPVCTAKKGNCLDSELTPCKIEIVAATFIDGLNSSDAIKKASDNSVFLRGDFGNGNRYCADCSEFTKRM